MTIDEKLANLESISRELETTALIYQKHIHTSPLDIIATGCLEIAIEHVRSIVILTRRHHYASAFALDRVFLEALVRHYWWHHCAEPQDIEKLKTDGLKLQVGKMITALRQKKPKVASFIDTAWKNPDSLNSYTHTGRNPIFFRLINARGSIGGRKVEDTSEHLYIICEAYLHRVCMAYSEMCADPVFLMDLKTVMDEFEIVQEVVESSNL